MLHPHLHSLTLRKPLKRIASHRVGNILCERHYFERELNSNLEVETSALASKRTDLAIGHSDMGWMNGIALECLRTLESAVEHQVTVR